MIKIPISKPRVDDRRPRPRRGRSSRITRARVDRARRSFRARTREVRLARGLFFPPFPVFRRLSLSRASRVASRVSRRRRARRLPTRRDATGRSVERKPTTTNDDDDDATNERTHARDETVYFSVVRRRVVASRVSRRRQRPPLEPLETLADGWSRRVCSFIRDDARARGVPWLRNTMKAIRGVRFYRSTLSIDRK